MKKRHFLLSFTLLVAVPSGIGLLPTSAAQAQNAKPTDAAVVKISARDVEGEWGSQTGLRLEGSVTQPAHISHPQLDVAAPKIEVSFDDKRQFTKVTATGGVSFAVTLTQKGDGAQKIAATRIEAKCNNAVMERPTTGANAGARVLTLRGAVDGWYQIEGGSRNTLRGETVTLTSRPDAADALTANIEGGADGVRIELPPAAAGANAPNRGPVVLTAQNAVIRQQKDGISADADGGTRGVRLEMQSGAAPAVGATAVAGGLMIGNVVVTSRRAEVRQKEGTARFIGDAHAVSSGAAQKFDVSASEIMLTRSAAGDFDAIKTVGRAKVKLDLPKEKVAPGAESKASMRPEYLEVEADSADAQLAKNQLVFAGNVAGFYRLPAQPAKPNQPAPPTDYPFSGERVLLSYTPGVADPAQRWNLHFNGREGAPVQIEVPAVGFDGF